MDYDDLRREALRCTNLGRKKRCDVEAGWYRDRGIRLGGAADAAEAVAERMAAIP